MRIAFDHQAFCRQKTGGISRYFCRLAEQLSIKDQTVGIFAPLYRNQYLRKVTPKLVHGYGVHDYPPKSSELIVSVNGWISRPLIQKWRPNIVHETYFSIHRSYKGPAPKILTVFDMISELPEFGATDYLKNIHHSAKYIAVNRADHIICISTRTKQDLIDIFKVDKSRVSVIHLGCDALGRSPRFSEVRSPTSKPYLLYVGMREGYKNFVSMLQAIASSKRLKTTFDVVAFGSNEFSQSELALIKQLGFSEDQVRQLAGDDFRLADLYKGASAFIYPSKYEGFGLPPIEAMGLSCPVVSSQSSCMPEVIGDAAEYFDPNNIESMASAIENVVFSESRSCELIDKGIQRAKFFTWDRCAEETLSVYRSLVLSNE